LDARMLEAKTPGMAQAISRAFSWVLRGLGGEEWI
jgi:hypothetical protein